MVPGYIGLKEWAARLGVSIRRANQLVVRVDGATKAGQKWLLPVDAGDPRDQRYTEQPITDRDLDALFGMADD